MMSALALLGCTPDFEVESTVKDLRVLGISAEPPEILIEGGPISQQQMLCPRAEVLQALAAELMANLPSPPPMVTIRPLVADPRGAGRPVHYRAVACVSPVVMQGGGGNMMPGGVRETTGRGACPENAPVLAEGDATPGPDSVSPPFEVPLLLTRELLIASALADPLGAIYGLPITVQVTVSAGGEQVIARKRVLVNVRLNSAHEPNRNPIIPGVSYRRGKDDNATAWDVPQVKLGEELRIEPAPGEKQKYVTRVGDRHTGCVTIEETNEALRFAFYATTGSFSPDSTNTEPNIIRGPSNDPHKLEATYEAPKELLPGESAEVRIWIVTRDERAGSTFVELPLKLVP
jgi:hypothetical protein